MKKLLIISAILFALGWILINAPNWAVTVAADATTPAQNCEPNAISQDPCKEGTCFGYPHGVCESCTIGQCPGKDACDPNSLPIVYEQCQKDSQKGCASTGCSDPKRPYFDGYGNQFDYQGNLLHANCPYTDPISHKDNPYCAPISAPFVPIMTPDFVGK